MPSWGKILAEINDIRSRDPVRALDLVRRQYISSQHRHSKRAIILYATKWTQPSDNIPPDMISVSEEDIQGFMEAINGIKETELDLIMHSPGGSIAAADACVQYLRSKFTHIRIFVPYAAMSAATMIACAADEIVMGRHSFLGPIDPQFIMHTSLGARSIPAQTIIDQFKIARDECSDPSKLAVWLPMLQQYGPDLLVQCSNVLELSRTLVENWLRTYMLKDSPSGDELSSNIAAWLANHTEFKIHARHVNRDELRARGLKIINLEDDKDQQDFILSIFHATTHTFSQSGAVKIIENHLGNAFIQQIQEIMIQTQPNTPAKPNISTPHEHKLPNRKGRRN